MAGLAANVSPSQARVLVFIFVPDLGWYSKPSCAQQVIAIQPDGTWWTHAQSSTMDNRATRFAAYLVPAGFAPACTLGSAQVPASVDSAALAKTVVSRPDPFPQTLRFSGIDWIVKAPPAPVYPGPNTYSASNVLVDAQGRLHLRVTPCATGWCSAEIYSRDAFGYGVYRVWVESPLAVLDPNLVLGVFTWSEDGAFQNREIDVEFSRWGNPSSQFNAQYAVQPYTNPNNLFRFAMPPDAGSVHSFRWDPGQVTFQSVSGLNASGAPFQQWSYSQPGLVPPPDDARLHINFYLAGGVPPQDGREHEIVIGKVEFAGTAPAVSLAASSASVPASASSGTVSVNAAGGCAWSATPYPEWVTIT